MNIGMEEDEEKEEPSSSLDVEKLRRAGVAMEAGS